MECYGSPVSKVWTLNRQHEQQSESNDAELHTYTEQSWATALIVFDIAVSGFITVRLANAPM